MSRYVSDVVADQVFKRYDIFKDFIIDQRTVNKTIIKDNLFFRRDGLLEFVDINTMIKRTYSNPQKHKIAFIRANEVESLQFKDLCSLMDIDLKTVKENLKSYYRLCSENRMHFIGHGGMNSNILQFIYHLTKLVNYKFKISNSYIFEGDSYEYHNFIRIYDYNLLNPIIQMANMSSFRQYSNKANFGVGSKMIEKRLNDENDYGSSYFTKDCLLVGALDMAARKNLADKSYTLLSMLHNGSKGFIVQRQVPTGLETESYGKINSPLFMLNVLKMTEVFLQYCTDFLHKMVSNDKDVSLFEFDSKKFLLNKYANLSGNVNFSSNIVDFKINNRIYTIVHRY